MDSFEEIDVQKAKELIDQGNITIVDVRNKEVFEEGHIDNAQNIDDSNIEEFVQNTDKTKPVLCYCYFGNTSKGAAEYLKEQGFDKVYSMIGGYTEWQRVHEGVDHL